MVYVTFYATFFTKLNRDEFLMNSSSESQYFDVNIILNPRNCETVSQPLKYR